MTHAHGTNENATTAVYIVPCKTKSSAAYLMRSHDLFMCDITHSTHTSDTRSKAHRRREKKRGGEQIEGKSNPYLYVCMHSQIEGERAIEQKRESVRGCTSDVKKRRKEEMKENKRGAEKETCTRKIQKHIPKKHYAYRMLGDVKISGYMDRRRRKYRIQVS